MKIAIHLGLGDTIVCAAIIAKLATENEVVEIPCWKHNEVSVSSFFVNYPNVKVVVLDNFVGVDSEWAMLCDLRLGHYNHNLPQLPNEDFVQWFYRQAGIDISEKEKCCPIFEASKIIEQPILGWDKICEIPIIIHDDPKRNFNINTENLKTQQLRPYPANKSILQWANWLNKTTEIHCIDSSFLHLVECLPTTGKPFYHKYARPNSTDYNYLKKDWTILN